MITLMLLQIATLTYNIYLTSFSMKRNQKKAFDPSDFDL